jgi:DNA processing protein
MTNQHIILHLSLIDGIGPATIAQLCARITEHQDLSDLYACSARDIVERYHIAPSYAAKIVAGLADRSLFEQEYARIEKHAISWATLLDDAYPLDLRTIYSPPSVIYWKGTLPTQDTPTIAFVGSRKANRYGETTIRTLVAPLVEKGWCILSGGALGADSMAHEAALQAQGRTVSVLGSGLLQLYPRTNLRLFERILDAGGALVSSFPLMQGALPGNFPARNRIIAGMSKGCVVIQAARKSGARITALFALEQGREVFAVPGMIDDELAEGCNALIQEGAKLVMTVEDILVEFDPMVKKAGIPASLQQMSLYDVEPEEPKLKPTVIPSTMEGKIQSICKQGVTTDELLLETGLSLPELTAKLFDLQIEGLIEQNSAGMFITTKL